MDASSYDQIPYTSLAFPQTHPDHLATIARIFGISPPVSRPAVCSSSAARAAAI